MTARATMTQTRDQRITVRTAASLLGISTQRVYVLIQEGKLDAWEGKRGTEVSALQVQARLEERAG